MSGIKQIFLDLDGPLLDGQEKHYHCYRRILEKSGFKPIGIDEYWKNKRALVNPRDLLSRSGAEEIYDDFLTAWLAMIEYPDALVLDKAQEGAVDCLRSWREQGVELTLVTMRKSKRAIEDQLKSTALRRVLDSVVACDHAESGVGKADAVRKSFQGNGGNKESIMWTGDTEADWEAANLLGCRIVLLSNGLRNKAYLESLQGALVKPSISSLKFNVLGVVNVN